MPRGTTQKAYVLDRLEREGAVCGTDFLKAQIPRYAARIADLKGDGKQIVTEPCNRPLHRHETRQVQYRLLADGQASLFQ